MMKLNTARSNPVYRAGAFLLCLALVSVAFWSTFMITWKWDDFWTGGDYYSSYTAVDDAQDFVYGLREILQLRQQQEWGGTLNYSEQERLAFLEKQLDPSATNFRYQIHDQDGRLLDDNLGGASLENVAGFERSSTEVLTMDQQLHRADVTFEDDEADVILLRVMMKNGVRVECDPRESRGQYNEYGYFSDGYQFYKYDSEYDTRIRTREVVIEYGVARPMTVQDEFAESMTSYQKFQKTLPVVAIVALISCLLSVASLVFLCAAAGRQEDGTVAPGWQERIPYDVYLLLDCTLWAVLFNAGDQITWAFNQGSGRPAVFVGLGVFTLLGAALAVGLILTTTVRLKMRRLLRGTLVWRFFAAIGRGVGGVVRGWSLSRKTVIFFLLYLLGTLLTTLTVILIPVYQGFVLWCLCRWARQWRAIRAGTAKIVGGDPDYKIETNGMYRDLRQHAEQLNDLGGAIGTAVDERMQSERFKAELITNVSHDLKTPLTSIINYVDLLKKVPIENPQAAEYIEVLDRKSQRLKKLTEDLVEASKASTGSLTVNKERLGMAQLVVQALGEYEEKFEQKRLEVVPVLPDHEFYVWADGRHLWRVIDNLLSNCYKYALEGTRIYLNVVRWDGSITLSIKNISRQALNIPPDQLMERFVRGEESRSTEGSGLGLSIARSLTELQDGTFRLDIDGDLFKAAISFPEAIALPENAGEDGLDTNEPTEHSA